MDLLQAKRRPPEGKHRRTHAPAPNQTDRARCGAKIEGIVVNDGDPSKTTCNSCAADLRRDGILIDRRKKH